MDVVVLGSGAADGWPNPFCMCPSCSDAAARGELRGQSAALVDDTLMLDCGPEAPASVVRSGRSMADVRVLLITHAHVDHLGPHVLLSRSWVDGLADLCVVGPADAVNACRDWVGPGDPVRFVCVAAGDRLRLHGYDVRVLPARHQVFVDGDAVLYDVTGPDRSRLLWATDTGPWPRAWFDAVADARYDAVFLEETFGDRPVASTGHLGLSDFEDMVGRLREVGAVTNRTEVVAVHLGHHNPPISELGRRLGEVGARPGRDGEVVVLGETVAGRRAGPRSVFVTGGVRSGKSRYAENRLADVRDVIYVAAGGPSDPDSTDVEWSGRVTEHRRRRPGTWTTLETTGVADVLRTATVPVLVDCLATWLASRLKRHGAWAREDWDRSGLHRDVDDLLAALQESAVPAIVVSNEVGSGVVPPTSSGRLFRDELGRLNAAVASACDSVVVLVAGQPLVVR